MLSVHLLANLLCNFFPHSKIVDKTCCAPRPLLSYHLPPSSMLGTHCDMETTPARRHIYGLYILCGDLSCFVILCMFLYFHSPTLRKPIHRLSVRLWTPVLTPSKGVYSGSVKDSYSQVSVNNTNIRRNNEIGVWSSGYFLFQLGAGRIAPRKILFFLPGSGSFDLDDGPWGPVPSAVKCARVFVRRDCMCALARVWITGSCLLVCPVCTE